MRGSCLTPRLSKCSAEQGKQEAEHASAAATTAAAEEHQRLESALYTANTEVHSPLPII